MSLGTGAPEVEVCCPRLWINGYFELDPRSVVHVILCLEYTAAFFAAEALQCLPDCILGGPLDCIHIELLHLMRQVFRKRNARWGINSPLPSQECTL